MRVKRLFKTALKIAFVGSALMFIPLPESMAGCSDDPTILNTGYCTRNPEYLNGALVCIPPGFTCDGDDSLEQ